MNIPKTKTFENLTNQQFGKLTIINYIGVKYPEKRTKGHQWLCKCECGNEKTIAGNSLRFNKTKSCGCKQGNFKHGLSSDKKLYRKHRFKNPVVKLQHNVSTSVRDGIRERNGKKSGKTFQHLFYTTKELKNHLESLFEPWMNWDNYGGRNDSEEMTWHIDHIVPHSQFPYKSLDDPLFKECWTLSNLRPLEKIKNISKNKY